LPVVGLAIQRLFQAAAPQEGEDLGRFILPAWVLKKLASHLVDEIEKPVPEGQICFGTLLSREQYLPDIGN